MRLEIRDARGRVHNAGSHDAFDVALQARDSVPVSHLHRLSDDGRALASLDLDASRIQIRTVTPRLSKPRFAPVSGVGGEIVQFRWLPAGDGFVIVSTDGAWLLAPGQRAKPVLDPVHHRGAAYVTDVRVLPEGLLVSTQPPKDDDDAATVEACLRIAPSFYYVHVADAEVQAVVELSAGDPDLHAVQASARSDGRIALRVVVLEERPSTRRSSKPHCSRFMHDAAIQILRPQADGTPVLESTLPGPALDWNNFAARSPTLVYAMFDTVIAGSSELPFRTPSERIYAPIQSLWADPARDALLAADCGRVRTWRADGSIRWTWDIRDPIRCDEHEHIIHAARFDSRGEVVAAVGRSVLRLGHGKARRLFRVRRGPPYVRASSADPPREHETFVDDAVPLPDGGIAYAVVDIYGFAYSGNWIRCRTAAEVAAADVTQAEADGFAEDPTLPWRVRQFWDRWIACEGLAEHE